MSGGLRRLPLELALVFVLGLIMLVVRLRRAPRTGRRARGLADSGNTKTM